MFWWVDVAGFDAACITVCENTRGNRTSFESFGGYFLFGLCKALPTNIYRLDDKWAHPLGPMANSTANKN